MTSSRSGDQVAGHRVPLPGSDAYLWRVCAVRAAGFPARWVLSLAAPQAARAAEAVLDARRACKEARSALLRLLEDELDRSSADARPALAKALRRARKGRVHDIGGIGDVGGDQIRHWRAARDALARAERSFERSFAAEQREARAWLRRVGQDPRFREALVWQNPNALRLGVDKLLARPVDASDKHAREHEQMIARYLQRYCVKNDTIGFFGPLCYAALDPACAGVEIVHGRERLAARHVYFEGWALAALAEKLGQDPALRPWLRPRRSPLVGVHEGRAYLPSAPAPLALSEAEERLLALCDGERPAREVAAALCADAALGVQSEEDVYALLERLCAQGVAMWKLEAPHEYGAERRLREVLESAGPAGARARAAFEEIDGLRRRVAEAAGSAPRLAEAMADLDAAFARCTGSAPRRASGKMYAGRNLVFEECRSGDEVVVGASVIDSLAPILDLLVRASRWFTHHAARRYREEFDGIHADLAARQGTERVPFLAFWQAIQPLLHLRPSVKAAPPRHIQEVADAFLERWARILGLPHGPTRGQADARAGGSTRHLQYRSKDLAPLVAEAFDAPGPGWHLARYGSPDILLDARDLASAQRGELQIVMGELHMGINTLLQLVFPVHHPDPELIGRMVGGDHQAPLATLAMPADMFPYRVHYDQTNAGGYQCELTPGIAPRTRGRSIGAGQLVVERGAAGLVASDLERSLSLDVLELLCLALSVSCANMFRFMDAAGHRPRITIDNVVVQRESWQHAAAELSFAHARTAAQRFLEVRRWAREHTLPRFCFVTSPVEEKPLYVDLDSPLYVDMLCKLIRLTAARGEDTILSLSEMLPAHDHAWLTDAAGERHTSELRIVVVDAAVPAAAAKG